MRELKFRAWRQQVNRFRFFDISTGFNVENADVFKSVEQFTGLQDSDSVDVYEGDIVKHRKGYVWVVIFDDEEARFALKCKPPLLRPLHKDRAFNFEVIGNIHENPELFK